jgi:hypothetical protein
MDADVCINVFEKFATKLLVRQEVLFSLLCCYCYHAIRLSVNNSWIETMASLASVLSKVEGAKRHQASKMTEVLGACLGARPNEPRQYTID